MDEGRYLSLMSFPPQWTELGMFPAELSRELVSRYRPGDEEGSEHDRNGAFHWWLRRNPPIDVLVKLAQLTVVDPDPLMAADVRKYIARSPYANDELRLFLAGLSDDQL
jgi:hypothetical protein